MKNYLPNTRRLFKGRKFTSKPKKILHNILAVSVVIPSAKMSLLGNPQKLAVFRDSSLYATGGRPYGGEKFATAKTNMTASIASPIPKLIGVEIVTGKDGSLDIPLIKLPLRTAFTTCLFTLGWDRLPDTTAC